MSLTFLAPGALVCGLLLTLPIIVHLFKPRRIRVTPFSSLRWLQLTPQKLSRRIRWHQVLLFLLRFAFLSLLILALARPMLAPAGHAGRTDRFLVLDVSRSMAYQPPGQPTPMERARLLAGDLIRSAQPGDRTAVLLTGSQTRLLAPLTATTDPLPGLLEKVQPGLTDTDLGSSLPVILPQMARTPPGTEVEVCFLTDNQQHAWRQSAIARFVKDMPAKTRVRVINVGVAAAQNAWIARARLLQQSGSGKRLVRVEVGSVGDPGQERFLVLRGLRGVPDQTRNLVINPGQPAGIEFELPEGLDLRGQVARLHLEPADALPSDDDYLLNLDAQTALRVLLIEDHSTLVERAQRACALRTALEALAEVGDSALQVNRRTASEVQPTDLAGVDLVLLADVLELSDQVLAALEQQVKGGTGLVVFLGPAGKPTFLSQKLHKPLQPGDGLLPTAPAGQPVQPAGNRDPLAPLTGLRWTHPLLTGLADPVLGDLAQTRCRTFYRFEGALPEPADVLAWIDEETPALIDWTVGAGKVLILNTGLDGVWSDLPRRNAFVPLLDRMLAYAGRGGVRRVFPVGQLVTLPLTGWKEGHKAVVIAPGGSRLTPEVRPQGAPGSGRALLRLEDPAETGLYQVEITGEGAAGFPFVVEPGRADSVLVPMDRSTLEKWWEPAAIEIVTADEFTRQAGASARRGLWPWLLALAGFVLLAEMFLVHRLCPRVSPPLAETIVARRSSTGTTTVPS